MAVSYLRSEEEVQRPLHLIIQAEVIPFVKGRYVWAPANSLLPLAMPHPISINLSSQPAYLKDLQSRGGKPCGPGQLTRWHV